MKHPASEPLYLNQTIREHTSFFRCPWSEISMSPPSSFSSSTSLLATCMMSKTQGHTTQEINMPVCHWEPSPHVRDLQDQRDNFFLRNGHTWGDFLLFSSSPSWLLLNSLTELAPAVIICTKVLVINHLLTIFQYNKDYCAQILNENSIKTSKKFVHGNPQMHPKDSHTALEIHTKQCINADRKSHALHSQMDTIRMQIYKDNLVTIYSINSVYSLFFYTQRCWGVCIGILL